MPDDERSGGINIKGDGETHAGRDIVGRDSISNTTQTSSAIINEGGPVAHYAVLGMIGIAALTIIVMSIIAFVSLQPPASTPTPTATLTPWPTATSTATISLTPLPTHTATEPPSATSTATAFISPTPTATEPTPPTPTATSYNIPTHTPTATERPSSTPTATPTSSPTITPTPTSAVPIFDSFSDNCLSASRWRLSAAPVGELTPTPTAIPVWGNCLQARWQYFAEDDDRLSVFLDADATAYTSEAHSVTLTDLYSGYYKQVEVVLALDDLQVLTDTLRNSYLNVSVPLSRLAGDSDLEIRVGGTNSLRLYTQVSSRLTLKSGGYQSFGTKAYTLGQPITIAFQVKGNKLTAYVNNQVIAGPFSILSEPTSLTLGYYADPQTVLDGYFDEVRMNAIYASEISSPTAVP